MPAHMEPASVGAAIGNPAGPPNDVQASLSKHSRRVLPRRGQIRWGDPHIIKGPDKNRRCEPNRLPTHVPTSWISAFCWFTRKKAGFSLMGQRLILKGNGPSFV